jgi:hypothetical protein
MSNIIFRSLRGSTLDSISDRESWESIKLIVPHYYAVSVENSHILYWYDDYRIIDILNKTKRK